MHLVVLAAGAAVDDDRGAVGGDLAHRRGQQRRVHRAVRTVLW